MTAFMAGIAQAVVAVMWKKVAKAASEEFIEKLLDELWDIAAPKILKWLGKKAETTVTEIDDGLVEVAKKILEK